MSERTIFMTALEKNNPAERAAYLGEACAGDPTLRQRVEALLKSHDDAGSFLEAPIGEQMSDHTEAADAAPGANADKSGETQAEPVGRVSNPSHPSLELDFLVPSSKPGSLGRLDHYEISEVIGRGGMGVVLKAFDEVLQRVVAVKVLAPQLATNATARKRFIREAQAGAAVCHDHVVTIHAVDEGKAVPYLVMQCVVGMSLQEKLDRDGPLGLKEILRIGLQTACGLAAAHKQGLVHRDIKPANILLENGIERVKITDFGLARAVDDASVTQSGVITGTPQYMSPEQAHGEAVDHRSDLFSLGSVLYAMCTGRPPFRASGSMAVLKRVCEDTPRPIREVNPDIPEWLSDIIAKLHAKEPADRFQSATQVAELLSQHLAHLQQPAVVPLPSRVADNKVLAALRTPTKPAVKALRKWRKRRLVIEVSVLLALGIAALIWLDYTHPAWWKELWTLGSQAEDISDGHAFKGIPDEPAFLTIKVDDPRLWDPELWVTVEGEYHYYGIGNALPAEIYIPPGLRYILRVKKREQLVYTYQFSLAKGEKQEIDLSSLVKQRAGSPREADEFERDIAALPAEEQIKAVRARLKELNPGFDGSVAPSINMGVVTQFNFLTDHVTDISPVRALTGLQQAAFGGSAPDKNKLRDLSSLRGMKLKQLSTEIEPQRNAFVLRSIKTLEEINGRPAAEVWKSVDPKTIEAADFLVRAWESAKAGKWDEAEAEFGRATKAKPGDPQVWRWCGAIQAEGKRFVQAAACFNKALELASRNARAWWGDRGSIDDTICQWEEVFTRVAKLRPIDANLWIARARWFAHRGKWKEAADASVEVLQRDPDDVENWFMDAPLRLQIGDVNGYRHDCREMLTRFGGIENGRTADYVAKTCLLLPDAVDNLGPVIHLAKGLDESQLAGPDLQQVGPWYVLCRALAYYRADEFSAAAKQLLKLINEKPTQASLQATARALLAMAGHRDKYQFMSVELQQARSVIDQRMPKAERGERFGDDWHDWLRCQVLLREAEVVVK
jgi:serine/threonine protein kinase/tetratricopeptide (TPR) repeat protein